MDVRALDMTTWPAFADLVERHNGVWGGCWCMGFHPEGFTGDPAEHRARKERRVREGRAHAALIFDDELCVGWCQFGPVEELTRIKHRKAYESSLIKLPDWRITCFFVDKGYRGKGVASLALGGALELIAGLGGGLVESYPELIGGRKVSASFLHNGTVEMFERHGFARTRPLGKNHWVVARTVVGVSEESRNGPPPVGVF